MNIFAKIRSFVRPRPLSCQEVNRFIVDYLDGDLDDQTRLTFESHLRNCPSCGSFLDQYRATAQLIQDADEIEIPPAVIERTIEFLRNRGEGTRE